ncbi:MAG TPA: sulfotransferase [Fimbriimonadaceae bacterium]|jgi:tetratricopeptide (TPR) repeat protein
MSQSLSPLALAFEAYERSDLAQASDLASKVLGEEPRNIQALHLMGMLSLAKGDLRSHFEFLRRTLAIAPNHPPSLCALANIRRNEGKLTEAIELARRAIEVAPKYANAFNTIGLCEAAQENYDEAIEFFNHAIRLNPGAAAIYLNLGSVQQKLNDYESALASYRRATELAPALAEAFDGLASVYSALRNRRSAIENFEKALSLTPSSPIRMLRLADARAMSGESEASLQLIEKALSEDPQSAEAHYQLGLRLQELGKFQQAEQTFLRSIELKPDQGGSYLGLFSNSKVGPGQQYLIERVASLKNAGSVDIKDRVLLHTALGKAYDDLGNYEQAINEIDEATRLEIERGHGRNSFDADAFEEYVGSIIETFTTGYSLKHEKWGSSSTTPIFIIGLPRSGTTLTEQILSRHPQVAAAGEQPFWSDVDSECKIVSLAEEEKEVLALAQEYEKRLRVHGPEAHYVTDKRPDNFLFLGFLYTLFPKAKFIHCQRNQLDNAISLYMTPYRVRPPFTQSRENIVSYVEQYQRLMAHWRTVLPPNTLLDVSYESTVNDQKHATKRLLEFCNLDWDASCLAPEQNKRNVSTPSNWQARQKVYQTSVERWRHFEPWLGPIKNLK